MTSLHHVHRTLIVFSFLTVTVFAPDYHCIFDLSLGARRACSDVTFLMQNLVALVAQNGGLDDVDANLVYKCAPCETVSYERETENEGTLSRAHDIAKA